VATTTLAVDSGLAKRFNFRHVISPGRGFAQVVTTENSPRPNRPSRPPRSTCRSRWVIAAAGAQNLLMLGPPGLGKTEYIPQHATVDAAAPPERDISLPRCTRQAAGSRIGHPVRLEMTKTASGSPRGNQNGGGLVCFQGRPGLKFQPVVGNLLDFRLFQRDRDRVGGARQEGVRGVVVATRESRSCFDPLLREVKRK
jgi:hypothetical protein